MNSGLTFGKTLLLTFVLVVMSSFVFSQRPIIRSISKASGSNQDIVTITGNNFGSDPTKLVVFFGAVKGTVDFASNQVLEVRVPEGTTFENISVSNIVSGLTGFSGEQFLLTYPGDSEYNASNLEGQKDFDAKPGLYDLCSCDFDGDNRPDVLGTTEDSRSVALFTNKTLNAGIDEILFDKIEIELEAQSIHAKCGDLNGDGKADLVITEARDGDRIFILQNTSSGEGDFQFQQDVLALSGKKVKRIAIADVDADGRPDLTISNQTGNTLTVIPNKSNLTQVSFDIANAKDIVIPTEFQRGTDAVLVQDLNSDNIPELITSKFQTAQSNVYIVANKSTPGNFDFGEILKLDLTGTAANLRIADLDQDDKPEITATLILGSSIAVFKNRSENSQIIFDENINIETDERPYGLDFGDLNGDNKIDVAVASIINKSISILINKSTPGNIQFETIIRPTTYINRHVSIGDIDGDAKPDVAFTSIDDNSRGIPASKISILRNTHCIKGELFPEGPHTICEGGNMELFTMPSSSLSYEWKKNGSTIETGLNAVFTVSESGNYSVTTSSVVDGGCSHSTNSIVVSVVTESPLLEEPSIEPIDPICKGTALQLQAKEVAQITKYKWVGPDGYEATGLQANPPVSDFQRENAGRYTLEVYTDRCRIDKVSIVAEILDAPSFQLNVGEEVIICDASSKTLVVSPQPENFAFQWFERSAGELTGQTGTSLLVTSSGEYYARATTTPSCASGETTPSKIVFASQTVASFDSPGNACPDQAISFTNTTSFDSNLTVNYKWDFGDGNESTETSPEHTYAFSDTYDVKLVAFYNDGSCVSNKVTTINIDDSPELSITTDNGLSSICPDGELTLSVEGDFSTFKWSTGSTEAELIINEPGTYNVSVSTEAGCDGSSSITIGEFEAPVVSATAQPTEIEEGNQVQLVANGLINYLWEPAELVDNPETPTPIATPRTTTLFKVRGQDGNGCTGEAQVQVFVKGDVATKKIVPAKYFTPNTSDNINPNWTVDRILDYPHCEVQIFNDKGVRVFQAKPYLNDWDGTFNGKPVPDGVYFFIIKCDGEENSPKTGSITLLR